MNSDSIDHVIDNLMATLRSAHDLRANLRHPQVKHELERAIPVTQAEMEHLQHRGIPLPEQEANGALAHVSPDIYRAVDVVVRTWRSGNVSANRAAQFKLDNLWGPDNPEESA